MTTGGAPADDNPYHSLTQETDPDPRWAFGTGFSDPLAGVTGAVPDGVAGEDLAAYCLMLGDDALVFSHRLQEWMTRAPELEEEAALANVALDLLGQARLLLQRAGRADGSDRSEDDYAFDRREHEFRQVRLVEGADPDFGALVLRLLIFSTFRLAVLDRLRGSHDPVLSAIAGKAVPELTYHRDYAAAWVIRLGDGTPLSHRRMTEALATICPLVLQLFTAHPVETRLAAAGVAVDPAEVRAEVDSVLRTVFEAATLSAPVCQPLPGVVCRVGRSGVHTEAFGHLLAERQSVARAYPGATW